MPSATISRRRFLATALAPALAPAAPARRPNIVVVMTDDHGAWATGAYGCSEIRTPHIDALARGGMRFTRAFAATPVCSPSRMTYATGKLPSSHGVQDWLMPVDSFGAKTRNWLDGHATYPALLAAGGYHTGMTGKWHMGQDETAQQGFSYWATVPGGGGTFLNAEFVRNGERVKTKGFKEDFIGDCAAEFISQDHGGRPFFLLVPFYAPHTPYDYQPDEDRAHYADAAGFNCYPRTPMHEWQNRGLSKMHLNKESMRGYSALITAMDRVLGRIVAAIDKAGARNDTLIIFTADQGWNAGHHGVWGKGNGTWPFNMYDESIRVPMIWNHPGRVPAGRTSDAMVSSYDLFPSLLDYAGIAAPPADPARVGRSYAPIAQGRRTAWTNRLYFEYSYVRAVRTENLKYIERTGGYPSELYDLEADPGETKNLIAEPAHQKQLEGLRRNLAAFFKRAGAPEISGWRATTQQQLQTYQAVTR
ncbi:MAG: sulfatase [Acidobacteria bacterium]|nr:sulfatase [Acidobacteriota bacterium]